MIPFKGEEKEEGEGKRGSDTVDEEEGRGGTEERGGTEGREGTEGRDERRRRGEEVGT